MAENSKIEWTDHTFNPWIGCTKVSPGCKFCYAENETFTRTQRAQGRELWGKGKPRHRTSETYWKQPFAWNREAQRAGVRRRVFCASMADVFDAEVSDDWRKALFSIIIDTRWLDWQLLTKRPENALKFYREHVLRNSQGQFIAPGREQAFVESLLPNVWIGTSVEDQPRADQRIPELLKIPARVRFLSVEPMLGPILLPTGINWAIFGGESGPGARPCNIEWIRNGVKQCRAGGVAPFVKQLGAYATCSKGFRLSLSHKKGGDMSEWPFRELCIRQFPTY